MNSHATKRWVVLLAACLAMAPSIFSQSVNVNLFETRFTVTDHNGQFVPNLKKSDFTIFDNDVRQDIDNVEQKLDSPVSIAVILDRSASIMDRFPFVLDSAATFIQSVMRRTEDRGLVVAFDSKVYLLHDWSAEPGALVDSMRNLSSAGGTSVFDAIYKTCRDKFDMSDTRRKVIVIVTDGDDTTSQATYDQTRQMAQRSDAALYVVGIRAEDSMNSRELQGRRVLTSLAELTGGHLYYPQSGQIHQLTATFEKLQEEIRNEYRIDYYGPAVSDGTFHKVRIETRNKNLEIHSATGYFNRRPAREP